MTRLVGRIAIWQVGPLGSRPEDPKHSIEYFSRLAPRPTATVSPLARLANERSDELPLRFGEIHSNPSPTWGVGELREVALTGPEMVASSKHRFMFLRWVLVTVRCEQSA